MPIVNILKRASSYILGNEDDDNYDDFHDKNIDLIYEDNEVLFCKNNVCVHPPAFARQESDILHYPGYLTVTTKTFTDQYNNAKRPTLLLTWIPNSTLRKCPSTVENNHNIFLQHLLRQNQNQQQINSTTSIDDLKQNKLFKNLQDRNNILNGSNGSIVSSNNTNPFLEPNLTNLYNNIQQSNNSNNGGLNSDNSETVSISSNSIGSSNELGVKLELEDDEIFITTSTSNKIEQELLEKELNQLPEKQINFVDETDDEKQLRNELEPLLSASEPNDQNDDDATGGGGNGDKTNKTTQLHLTQQLSVTSVNITISNPLIQNHDLSPTDSIVSTSNHHSIHSHHHHSHHHTLQNNDRFMMRSLSISSTDETSPNWMTPELLAYKHNLSFPESQTASPIITRKIPLKCRRFSVDLSQMRSLRLFFNDENCTSGQLVIASRESQYKILHFHHGGLDHLAQVLHQWHCLLHNIKLAPGNLG